ncbi:MAG: sugar ABC transporter ATP-binding protein [Klebsiella michiganensis]|nr:sugar ABC transporter ATP-binding protein [Klebsiella michiganensis]
MPSLLEVKNVSKSFPGVKALDNVNITLGRGEVHALLGENGAGKSTLMKILCGIYQPDAGNIFIDGKQQHFHNYRDAIACGVGIIFQEFSLIPYLNAYENIFLNREKVNRFGLLDRKAMRREALRIFKDLGVTLDPDEQICHLSVAEQQFVEIAKALSLDARILILDEPTATLTPSEAEHLFRVMRDLKAKGVGMFFISHHLEEIYEICDSLSILRDGKYIGSAKVDNIDIAEMIQMMVGREVENIYPERRTLAHDEILLEAEIQLTESSQLNRLTLRKGEILGLAGLVGSGRSEAILALTGADKCFKKRVRLAGKEVTIMPFSVKDNIWLNKHACQFSLIRDNEERLTAERLINHVGVKTPDAGTAVGTLSGGNQQKVVISRWLNHDVNILIFDEPTRGIDVGAKSEIYQIMRDLTAQGISIIMISSELPEVIGVSDRVMVFRDGNIVAELENDQINSTVIMLHAAGNII